MRKYTANIVTILACYIASVLGANTPPELSALGKIIFPSSSPAPTISDSSGALTIAAGGSNQFLGLKPSGTGEVRINANAATLPASSAGTLLHIGNADSTTTRVTLDAFASNAFLMFRRYDGTAASPTAVQSGEILGSILWGGYGSTAVGTNRAQFRAIASENWTDAAQGTSVSVVTTPTGGTATAEAARFFGSGGLSVGSTTDPGAGIINAATKFSVNGTGGTGGNTLFTVCTSGACITSCTLQFNGGIRVGGTCP